VAISKRLRYEVFRRDNHACRYCGATAPQAKLTVDHVVPTSLGGTDEPSNLLTACSDCNFGKSASTPDAALVTDVSADALRWGRAVTEAARILEREYQERVDLHRQFQDAWDAWTYGYKNPQTFPLPSGWEKSIDSILAAGLPMPVLTECVDLAMAVKHVRADSLFRYMCGIAWRKVTELREIAGSLLEADQES
jgi:HNH endonuclease